MDNRPQQPILVIFLRDPLTMAFVDADPGVEFSEGGLCFVAKGYSDFTAFYDRLCDSSGRIVGVQLTPLTCFETVAAAVAGTPSAELRPSANAVRVFFTERDGDAKNGDEQAFGGRIYQASSGDVGISMSTDWLSSEDIHAIRDSDVRWTSVRAC